MKIDIIIDKKQIQQLREIPRKLNNIQRNRLSRILVETAVNIKGEAQQRIQTGPRSGRFYRKASGRLHQASAPGEYPASDTGQLVNSIRTAKQSSLAIRVGSVVWHGFYLELGTRRLKKRPWLRPTTEDELKTLAKKLKTEFSQEFAT